MPGIRRGEWRQDHDFEDVLVYVLDVITHGSYKDINGNQPLVPVLGYLKRAVVLSSVVHRCNALANNIVLFPQNQSYN
jgi:hypothetical protein